MYVYMDMLYTCCIYICTSEYILELRGTESKTTLVGGSPLACFTLHIAETMWMLALLSFFHWSRTQLIKALRYENSTL